MADDRKKDDLSPFPAIFLGAVAARNLAARGDDRPLKAMDLAETLRRKGASEATIYAETNKILDGSPYAGVSYGADGKPRFELTDHESRLRPGALDRSGHGLQGEVLTHPKLYDAMPEARYLEVQKGGQGSGGYTGDKVLIGDQHFSKTMLLGRPQAKATARGVNLHELQHHVQEVEGFAPGGSPRDFERQFPGERNEALRKGMYKALAGEVEAENTRERANFTAKERREIPPARTAKLKRSEQIVTDQHGAIQEIADPSSIKIAKRADGADVQFSYDKEMVARFRKAFPKARWNPQEKTWNVPGKTADRRASKWLATEQDAASKFAKAESDAKMAADFDAAHPKSRYVSQGSRGYQIATPYDPKIVEAIKRIPGAEFNSATKKWTVPYSSREALSGAMSTIDGLADKIHADRLAIDAAREAERAADRQRWAAEKLARDQQMAKVRASRFPEHPNKRFKQGDVVRSGGKVVVVTGFGKGFTADDGFPSVWGSEWLGHEYSKTRYVYTREATPAEIATLEAREGAAKIAAEQRSQVLSAARSAQSEIEAKFQKATFPRKLTQVPSGETLAHFGKQNAIYGGGTEYRLSADGKFIWRIQGNGADGDDWSRNNAPGSVVSKVRATKEAIAKLKALGEIESTGLRGTQNPENLRAILEGRAKGAKPPDPKAPDRIQEMADDSIRDFGEKIGGARKDRAVKTGPRPKTEGPADTRPGWQRRFVAAQKLSGGEPSGEWVLLDTRKTSRFGNPPASRMTFPSKEAAERAIPLIAVSQKHTVREVSERMPDGSWKTSGYAIWRKVGDKRVVKAVAETFPTRDAALLHMAANADRLMGSAKGYGEEILARPEKVVRTGPDWRAGDVMPERMMADLKARGVEFGHWQGDRQKVVNMAYDAMRDLSDVTGVAPESLSLQQRLGLAFGARGHGGKQGGAAHYERTYAAINLTREKGAGHLAHEWMHALDHYLGTVDDPKLGEFTVNAKGEKVLKAQGRETDYASHRVAGRTKGQLPDAVRQAYADLMNAMLQKPEQVTVESSRYERQAAAAREALKSEIASIRQGLEQRLSYGKRFTAPATAEQLARFDQAAEKILAGELAVEWKPTNPDVRLGARGSMAFRWTGPQVDALSNVMKEVRGRAGFDGQNHSGPMDRVAQAMRRVATAEKLAADIKATPTQTVMRATDYAREAARIDQTRTTPYWSTKHEMVARAFSAYVEDKLAAQGRSSNYLAFGSDNAFYKPFGVNPFPDGAERAAINQKFDNLFKAMRETGLVKPAVASSAPSAGAPFGTATAAEAMKAAKGQETSGLRGTQNPENLKAIVDNRQADAALVPARPGAESYGENKVRAQARANILNRESGGGYVVERTSAGWTVQRDPSIPVTAPAGEYPVIPQKPLHEIRNRGNSKQFFVYADGKPIKDAKGGDKWFGSREKAQAFIDKRDAALASVTSQKPSVTDGGQKTVADQGKPRTSVTRSEPKVQRVNMPETVHEDVRGVPTQIRPGADGDPFKYKSKWNETVEWDKDGYPGKTTIVHAATLQEYEAKLRAIDEARVAAGQKPRHVWDDKAREAAAKARGVAAPGQAKPKDPRVAAAVERAIARANENAAKPQVSQLLPKAETAEAKPAAPVKPLSYDAAIKAARGNYRNLTGDTALAVTAQTMAEAHPGLNPRMVYEGAKAKGLTDSQLRKMGGAALGDLMFAEPAAPAPAATKQTVTDLRAEAKAAGIKGVSKMTKAALLKALDKTGAIAMVAAPAVAGLVAFDAARSEAKAAGSTDSQARMQGLAQGAVAATATGGVMYAVGKGVGLGLKALAKVAPVAAGPAGVAVAAGLTGYAAYKAYQAHGAKGAALSLVGAEGLLDLGKAPQPQAPTQGRLTADQAEVYAAAAKRYAAMKAAAQSEPEKRPKGWSNAARIAAAKARGAEVPYGGHAEQGPPQWAPSVSTTDVAAAMRKPG